jgi:hypothetical protein
VRLCGRTGTEISWEAREGGSVEEKGTKRLNSPDSARIGSADPGSNQGSTDSIGAASGSLGLSKGRGNHRIGIGIAVVLALGVALVVILGDIAFLVVGVGISVAVGVGFLIGMILCEALNRRNR